MESPGFPTKKGRYEKSHCLHKELLWMSILCSTLGFQLAGAYHMPAKDFSSASKTVTVEAPASVVASSWLAPIKRHNPNRQFQCFDARSTEAHPRAVASSLREHTRCHRSSIGLKTSKAVQPEAPARTGASTWPVHQTSQGHHQCHQMDFILQDHHCGTEQCNWSEPGLD